MRPACVVIGATTLAIAVVFAPINTSSERLTNQDKVIYQPTGSEGRLAGKISFEGQPPQPKKIDGSADPACEANDRELYTEDVIVKAGKLANVFVYVESGDALNWYSFEAPTTDVSVAHNGCQLTPHVLGMRLQQTLKIANDDSTSHNSHLIPKSNPDWNQSQPQGAEPLAHKFTAPELFIPLKCNQHPWEKALVSVLDHPFFAVSRLNGAYSISGLPPGQYTVVARHERFGEQRSEVSVGVKETKTLDFSFKAPDK
jgi:hypothetical protein